MAKTTKESNESKKARTASNKKRRTEKALERQYNQNLKMREIRAKRAERKAAIAQGVQKSKVKRNGVGNILVTRTVKDPDNPKSTIEEVVAILPCCEAKSFRGCIHFPHKDAISYSNRNYHLPRNAKNIPAVLC